MVMGLFFFGFGGVVTKSKPLTPRSSGGMFLTPQIHIFHLLLLPVTEGSKPREAKSTGS